MLPLHFHQCFFLFTDAAARTMIRQAMDEWEKYTCLTFVERTNQKNYVHIISADG